MLKPRASWFLFSHFLLADICTAQISDLFSAFPECAQPLLTAAFPLDCFSTTLTAQNSCLCKAANAASNSIVSSIAQSCGCSTLTQTTQLINAYCLEVSINVGPAFEVAVQDDTNCGTGGSSNNTATGAVVGATSTVVSNTAGAGTLPGAKPTSTKGSTSSDTSTRASGGRTVTVTATQPTSTQAISSSSASTHGSGDVTVTVTQPAPVSTSPASVKSSDSAKGVVINKIIGMVTMIVAGIVLAL